MEGCVVYIVNLTRKMLQNAASGFFVKRESTRASQDDWKRGVVLTLKTARYLGEDVSVAVRIATILPNDIREASASALTRLHKPLIGRNPSPLAIEGHVYWMDGQHAKH